MKNKLDLVYKSIFRQQDNHTKEKHVKQLPQVQARGREKEMKRRV